MKYTFFEKIFTFKETKEFVKAHFSKDKEESHGLVGVYLNDNDTLIGFAGILEFEYKNAKEYEFGKGSQSFFIFVKIIYILQSKNSLYKFKIIFRISEDNHFTSHLKVIKKIFIYPHNLFFIKSSHACPHQRQ